MKKKIIIVLVVAAVILAGLYLAFGQRKVGPPPPMTLFVQEGCPHCANVMQYLQDNNVASKITIEIKELVNKLDNQTLYEQKVTECRLAESGVPLLYLEGKCLVGDDPIIAYLKKVIKKL